MSKTAYNILNKQGAFLMRVWATNKQAAIRQAKKNWSGDLQAVEA